MPQIVKVAEEIAPIADACGGIDLIISELKKIKNERNIKSL
jgi:hypothetical protein